MGNIGPERQLELFVGSIRGQRSEIPVIPEALEAKAREVLRPEVYDHLGGGAGSESGTRGNVEAFERWRIVPRVCRDIADRELSISLLGMDLPTPILLSPMGALGMIHPDGDLGAARAAATFGIPPIISTAATTPLEEIAVALGDTPGLFQLYPPPDPAISISLVKRAEQAGLKAVVITVDTIVLGWRERDLQSGYLPFTRVGAAANLTDDPEFAARQGPSQAEQEALLKRMFYVFNQRVTWDGIDEIRKHTSLPVLLKGVLHPEDAKEAVRRGIDGIVVSTHGGRQLDSAVASLDALPRVVDAVNGRIPVLLDSGVRRGVDVLKAMALGASAVLLARPFMWGLAIAGEQGVREVLHNTLAHLDVALALTGYRSVRDVDASCLERTA